MINTCKKYIKEGYGLKLFIFGFWSENYIFGKFEAFCRRVDKVADVINVIESLASLNVVKIEGLEAIIVKYKSIVDTIKKKNYGKYYFIFE